MSNPTPKQLLVQTLTSLRKARVRALMRIKAIQRRGRGLSSEEDRAYDELQGIENKMNWEINTNGLHLRDRQ